MDLFLNPTQSLDYTDIPGYFSEEMTVPFTCIVLLYKQLFSSRLGIKSSPSYFVIVYQLGLYRTRDIPHLNNTR